MKWKIWCHRMDGTENDRWWGQCDPSEGEVYGTLEAARQKIEEHGHRWKGWTYEVREVEQ